MGDATGSDASKRGAEEAAQCTAGSSLQLELGEERRVREKSDKSMRKFRRDWFQGDRERPHGKSDHFHEEPHTSHSW